MLIIFGTVGIYLLERNHPGRTGRSPEPISIYHAGMSPRFVPDILPEPGISFPDESVPGEHIPPDGSAYSCPRVHSLGELGLHIEL